MDLITRDDLKPLLANKVSPCVSVYLPTHRGGAEADPIRLKGHLNEVEQRLLALGMRAPQAREFLASARLLLEDDTFWKHQCDGLALFLAPGMLRLFRLPLAFPDVVVVADHFHITPLLPLVNGNGRFFLLALSQNAVRLLQGTRDNISEVDLTGVPRNLAEALLTHDKDAVLTFHTRPVGSIGSWGAIFHGQGVGIDDEKKDLLRYFQQIDRGLHPLLSQEKAPLVLAAVDYLLPLYRRANTYPYLQEVGVEGNPDRLSNRELHERAWALVRPQFEAAQRRAADQFCQLAGTGRTASELEQILSAALAGEIETLFVPFGVQKWGRFDTLTGHLEIHEKALPGDEDLLNLAALSTLRHGRTVFAVDPTRIPGDAGLAAIFCLPLAKHGARP